MKERRKSDITGRQFERLTALYPTEKRDSRGYVIWRCRCRCGTEIEVSYNALVYGNMKSCGCQKKEHDRSLKDLLNHVSGTSLERIESNKIPVNNTTGRRGVYFIRGKYVAKIVFQKKAYYLGTFDNVEEAYQARSEAEKLLFEDTLVYYRKWEKRADADPQWAMENPVRIYVSKGETSGITVSYEPKL